MHIATLDFETFWDTDHTLSKMSPTEYVMHDKTEIQSLAFKLNNEESEVVFGEDDIKHALHRLNLEKGLALGHNMSGFDSMILALRFGITPKMWGCTAAMARPKYSKTAVMVDGKFLTGVSLKKLAVELDVGRKLNLEATNTKGKRLEDFTPQERRAMKEYNKVDTDLCYRIFKKLYHDTPKQEMLLIDMTTRMLVEPKFKLDTAMVEVALSMERDNKVKSLHGLAKQLGIARYAAESLEAGVPIEELVRTQLASAKKFGELLATLGVDVPMKQSPTNPERMTPALAKTDGAFIKLQHHKNPLVSAAAQARLEVKSTLLETRLQAFLRAGAACGGFLPVPLKYAGADTTGRWSGEQYNMQNLPRINPSKVKPSDALRNSLKAPKGHMIVVADLSGIELRVNHFLWKVESSMALFQADPEKADLYKEFASALYSVAKADVTKDQRQVGKVAHLGLGFGAGSTTFQTVAKLMAGIELTDEESLDVVNKWREEYADIVKGWKLFQSRLPDILDGREAAIDPWGMCVTDKNMVRLPSGRAIYYPSLSKERDGSKTEWWYGSGRTRARIYAGKGVENCVQALARDVIAEHAVQFYKQSKLRPALMVHDELVYVVPENEAQETLDGLQNIMRSGVSWWPELVTWSEGDIALSYGSAK